MSKVPPDLNRHALSTYFKRQDEFHLSLHRQSQRNGIIVNDRVKTMQTLTKMEKLRVSQLQSRIQQSHLLQQLKANPKRRDLKAKLRNDVETFELIHGKEGSKLLKHTSSIFSPSPSKQRLIPIKLQHSGGDFKVNLFLLWNVYEDISIVGFVQLILTELKCPIESWSGIQIELVKQMESQIKEIKEWNVEDFVEGDDVKMIVDEHDEDVLPDLEFLNVDEDIQFVNPIQEYPEIDLRIKIELKINHGGVTLIDEFDWDILDPFNDPEEFSHRYTTELGLSPDWKNLISWSIRNQIFHHFKMLIENGYDFKGWIRNSNLAGYFLSPITWKDGPDVLHVDDVDWSSEISLIPSIRKDVLEYPIAKIEKIGKKRGRRSVYEVDEFKVVSFDEFASPLPEWLFRE